MFRSKVCLTGSFTILICWMRNIDWSWGQMGCQTPGDAVQVSSLQEEKPCWLCPRHCPRHLSTPLSTPFSDSETSVWAKHQHWDQKQVCLRGLSMQGLLDWDQCCHWVDEKVVIFQNTFALQDFEDRWFESTCSNQINWELSKRVSNVEKKIGFKVFLEDNCVRLVSWGWVVPCLIYQCGICKKNPVGIQYTLYKGNCFDCLVLIALVRLAVQNLLALIQGRELCASSVKWNFEMISWKNKVGFSHSKNRCH